MHFRVGGIVRLIMLAIMVVGVSLFTLANRHTVLVSGWPLDLEIKAPMAMIVFLSVLVGMSLGSLMMAEPMINYRMRAKRSERRATILEFQIAQQSVNQASTASVPVPPKLKKTG